MGIATMIYRKSFVRRYDDDGIIHYFSYRDFEGLQARPVSFRTPQDTVLRGYLYSYEPVAKPEQLVVVCHGMGGGHRSYMREIELICRQGYQVLSYDVTGCWESEGKDIRGLSESINALVSCLDFVYASAELCGRKLHIIGHSWGGFAAGNILNFRQQNICSVTVISGFASIIQFSEAGFGSPMKKIIKPVLRYERSINPRYADACWLDCMKDTSVRVLLVHSNDDKVADISTGLGYVRANIDNPNVGCLEVSGKFHNPNYTTDAVTYMQQVFGTYEAMVRDKKFKSEEEKKAFMDDKDFMRMTEQDPEVWKAIFDSMEASCPGAEKA
ncbi:MAG: alpha/beta fold hydrolase [Spirochaetales bacterium]|nr:alpha/beta fold hydrolase [Spirochaetales bacterium]